MPHPQIRSHILSAGSTTRPGADMSWSIMPQYYSTHDTVVYLQACVLSIQVLLSQFKARVACTNSTGMRLALKFNVHFENNLVDFPCLLDEYSLHLLFSLQRTPSLLFLYITILTRQLEPFYMYSILTLSFHPSGKQTFPYAHAEPLPSCIYPAHLPRFLRWHT